MDMARALAAAVGPMGKLLKTTGRILAENIHFNLSPFVISELQRLHNLLTP
jgi:hypothetical protein